MRYIVQICFIHDSISSTDILWSSLFSGMLNSTFVCVCGIANTLKSAKNLVSQATTFAEKKGLVTLQSLSFAMAEFDVTNQICIFRRSHPLSWSTTTSQLVQHLII